MPADTYQSSCVIIMKVHLNDRRVSLSSMLSCVHKLFRKPDAEVYILAASSPLPSPIGFAIVFLITATLVTKSSIAA